MHVMGIPIRLHVSFLVVLPFLAVVIGNNIGVISEMAGVEAGLLAAHPFTLGFVLAVLLFTSVALHELAHSVVAMRQGMEIHAITLMLLGGVAEIEEATDERDELWMAFAGPALSLVLGLLLLFVVRPAATGLPADMRLVIYYVGYMNIFLAAFNMIPAFPSDGGRILRSALARRTSYLRATQIATAFGRAFALLFGLFGFLIGNLILVLIAFFIYIGASQEYQANVLRDVFSDFRVRDLMTREVATIKVDMTVQELMDRMMQETHSGYPVLDEGGNLVGCVTLGDIRSLPDIPPDTMRVGEIMSRELISVHPGEDLFSAFKKLSEEDIGRLFVMEGGGLVGIITRSDIMKAYRVRELREEQARIQR